MKTQIRRNASLHSAKKSGYFQNQPHPLLRPIFIE